MDRLKAAMIVVLGTTLGACQQGADQKAADAEALEKRIAALEQQQTPPSAVPVDPAAVSLSPEPGAQPTPADVAPPAPAPARTRAATATRRAAAKPVPRRTADASRPTAGPAAEPVERIGGEPVERIEPMAGTGDPGPRRDRLVIPSGTELRIVLETALSSDQSEPGQRVVARVERATSRDGRVVLPGGTVLRGRVVRADAAGRVRGVSHLSVDFDRIVVRGQEHPLRATSLDVRGADDTRRDAAVIAGSTAAGAIIGKIMDKGAKKGAVVGAATGAGAVLVTRGENIEMPAGSRWTVRVTDTVRLN
jgi:hypothetical protein